MKQILIITADTNDADYVTAQHTITSEAQVALVTKVAAIIKSTVMPKTKWGKQFHNWPNGELLRTDMGEQSPAQLYGHALTEAELEEFEDLLPTGEYGIHSVTSIELLDVVKEQQLF